MLPYYCIILGQGREKVYFCLNLLVVRTVKVKLNIAASFSLNKHLLYVGSCCSFAKVQPCENNGVGFDCCWPECPINSVCNRNSCFDLVSRIHPFHSIEGEGISPHSCC